jgi:PHD/YefM family antitoxin component YafN of YafNO toxin-antitoxin module
MGQTIVLRLKAGSHDVFHLPAPRTTENELGRFGLTVETEGDWVTVTRELDIAAGVVSPDQWPMLRALLLEETDARNRTILLK